jgi:hypothetical protein
MSLLNTPNAENTPPDIPPDEFLNRAAILYCNSLYGYQCPGHGISKDIFVICWCADDLTDEQVQRIKDISSSLTVKYGDYIGYSYISIKWFEYNKITDIFNAMLQMGLWFKTNNRAAAIFRPSETRVFSKELMEQKFIQQTKELIQLIPNAIPDDYYIRDEYLQIWNYLTNEGRTFCRYLRELRHLPDPDMNHQDNYLTWPVFQNYDPNTLLSINTNVRQAETNDLSNNNDDEDDESLCLICMVNEANTMVLPCECVVCCKGCSIALRNTNDHHTCVKCRRPITNILE